MTNKPAESKKSAKLYTIHSQKGGVGKTSVAIAIAGLEAVYNEKTVLLIDADLTGTSLADIKAFESFQLNDNSKYFNDLILASPEMFLSATAIKASNKELSKYLCEYPLKQGLGSIHVSPGSPFYKDIRPIIPLISQEDHLHFFAQRMEDIIVAAICKKFDVIVIDHPPGLFGVSLASLLICLENSKVNINPSEESSRLSSILAMKQLNNVKSQAILVTTPDRADHTALVHAIDKILYDGDRFKADLPPMQGVLHLLINKAISPDNNRFDPVLSVKVIFDNLKGLDGYRKISNEIVKLFDEEVKSKGPYVCQSISDFNIERILSSIKNMRSLADPKTSQAKDLSGMSLWCKQLHDAIVNGQSGVI